MPGAASSEARRNATIACVELALTPKGGTEVVVGHGEFRLEPDRLAEGSLRWGVVVLDVAEDGAEVEVGSGVVGLEPDRRAVFGDGLVQLALVSQGVTEVDVGIGGVGLEPGRCAEFGDRFVELALDPQGVAEVGVGDGRRRA